MLVAVSAAGCKKENSPKIEERVVFELQDAKSMMLAWVDDEFVVPDSASARYIFCNFGSEKIEDCHGEMYLSYLNKLDTMIIYSKKHECKYQLIDTLLFMYLDPERLDGYEITALKDNRTWFYFGGYIYKRE